ncbi:MAG: hypothetical protein Q7S54_01145 [bacterium]|nr:hypothetical protein [bacterium]
MKELQRKQRMRRLMYSIPTLCLLALVSFALAKGAFGIFVKERESSRVVRELEEKTLAAEERKSTLEASIARLLTEEGIVEEIKNKFNVTREGEYVAIIVDERFKATTTDVSGEIWYKRLWAAMTRIYTNMIE